MWIQVNLVSAAFHFYKHKSKYREYDITEHTFFYVGKPNKFFVTYMKLTGFTFLVWLQATIYFCPGISTKEI